MRFRFRLVVIVIVVIVCVLFFIVNSVVAVFSHQAFFQAFFKIFYRVGFYRVGNTNYWSKFRRQVVNGILLYWRLRKFCDLCVDLIQRSLYLFPHHSIVFRMGCLGKHLELDLKKLLLPDKTLLRVVRAGFGPDGGSGEDQRGESAETEQS
ncbi:MAG: hypothetical protein IJ678_01830 [Kiritimatiellae bacterium]|nr:hypothetical protein [Kiritimatiellia bacterium]